MSVLSSIPTRFRVVLIGVACLGISLISQAQIVLNVSGGKLGTPLTINITSGASFLATTAKVSGFGTVIFNEFWNNTASTVSSHDANETVTFNGSSDASLTGAIAAGSAAVEDLMLGFISPSISNGNTVALTTGTRITGNLSLNYTSINATGTAFITDNTGTAISNSSVTWTTVPEPSTYAAISGLVCLGGAIARRRFKRS